MMRIEKLIDALIEIKVHNTTPDNKKTGEDRKIFLQNLETLEDELGLEIDTSNNVLVPTTFMSQYINGFSIDSPTAFNPAK